MLPYAPLSVACLCVGVLVARPSSPRDPRYAAYAATPPALVGFGAILLTFLAEAKVPGGHVHG